MNKNEFIKYVAYLKELFPRAAIPKTNSSLETWYKPFKNTHVQIAKDMADMYLQDEQNSFNYARLLQYKSKAMAGKTFIESKEIKQCCKKCNSTGMVQVEDETNGRIYTSFYRCDCENGMRISDNISIITNDILADKIYDCGMYKVVNKRA